LTKRLDLTEATVGLDVDIAPRGGKGASSSMMATRAESGRITGLNITQWNCCAGMRERRQQIPVHRIVKVEKVYAPNFVIPWLKKDGSIDGNKDGDSVCLGDFGEPPFTLPLELNRLKNHVPSDSI
jgi:hypothetical protein